MTSRYSANFHGGRKGNALKYGDDLIIFVSGDPLFITGQLFKLKRFGRKNLIQIEQTGTRQNPQKDNIEFELKKYVKGNLESLPTGKYQVKTTTYFNDLGGKSWTDNFEIE